MPQPTSNPGHSGGENGPTRPTYLPLDLSSTANIVKPCSAQCPAMIAALRHPPCSLVITLPSGVMKRPESGSDNIAVFAAMSLLRHGRRISRGVSMNGPSAAISLAPGLSGGIIGFLIIRHPGEGRDPYAAAYALDDVVTILSPIGGGGMGRCARAQSRTRPGRRRKFSVFGRYPIVARIAANAKEISHELA